MSETISKSMTYGVLPTRDEFTAAFDSEVPGRYRIQLGTSDARACDGYKLGDGEWTEPQLWDAITEIVNDSEGDDITVSEDDEYENVFQVFYEGSDRAPVEIGPDAPELIEWANRFSKEPIDSEHRAIECLNFAAAYGEHGQCFQRRDAAMDLVSGIMTTLGFEWI